VGGITAQETPPKVGALINFDHDSTRIKPESYDVLDNLGKALNGGLTDAVILVAGHTDSDGTDEYNYKLSVRRAQSVADFLIYRHRIDEQRLIIQGYGEASPISDNLTLKGKALNRRVEFVRRR
jgi:OOP family OmpA-OmpF porin